MKPVTRLSAVLLALGLSAAASADQSIGVDGAWTRATPPGAANSATYVTLSNSGSEDREVVAARTDAAKKVELHTVLEEDGLMKMRQVTGIQVPAGGTVALKPGGYHIMMLGIHEQLREGESVDIEIEFANGETLSFSAPVKKMMGMPMKHGEMDHSKMEH